MARVSRKSQTSAAIEDKRAARVWRAALYVRLSVEDNGKDSDSIENQIALLEAFVKSHPYLSKAALYVDNGYTGTDFQRPEFTRMMEAVRAGSVDCVIVKDLSRLGRDYIETSRFIEKICPFFDLRFISVNDHYDTATSTSDGQLSASLSNIVNDYYAKDISRKVKSALQAKMERGEFVSNYAPYGYFKDPANKNHLIPDPQTAPVVKQIFEWRAQGVAYMAINKRLNDAGIASPGQYRRENGIETNNNKKQRKLLWNKHIVTSILSNVVYTGCVAQSKNSRSLYAGIPDHKTNQEDWIIVEGTHEPLIDKALFEKVQMINQETLERARAGRCKYPHLQREKNYYGKRFVCGSCGAVMKLQRSYNKKRDKVYYTFKCPTYAEHGARACSDIKIRKSDLDNAVLAFIQSQIAVFVDMENTLKKLLETKKTAVNRLETVQETSAVKQALEKKRTLLSTLYADLKEGFLSQEDYYSHREIITADIAALETKLAGLEAADGKAEERLYGEMKWKSMVQRFMEPKELSSELVDAFIESMSLAVDGSLDIRLNYRDEFASLMEACKRLAREAA